MSRLLGFLVACFLAGAAFASLGSAALGAPLASASGPPKLTLAGSQYGRVLFDGQRRALYAFTRDPRGRSVCSGECAVKWPPYIVRGRVAAGAGVRASLIGTTRRADGRLQVVYAGRPLYFYVDDPKGKVLCGNVSEFGGVWLVVAASGKLLR